MADDQWRQSAEGQGGGPGLAGSLGAAPFPVELLIWLSPAFPVGSFAYSQGLEAAVARGDVRDAGSLVSWLGDLTRHGALRNDLIVLSLAWRAADQASLTEIADIAYALQPSRQRAEETRLQGEAFWAAYVAAWVPEPAAPPATGSVSPAGPAAPVQDVPFVQMTLPVAVGWAAKGRALPLDATLIAFAAGFLSNLTSAAIRLGVIGQFDGQRVLARLMSDARESAGGAAISTLDDLGSCVFGADLASMEHETLDSRLFRS